MLSNMSEKREEISQPVRVRPTVAALPRYVAGAGVDQSEMFKLSSNETAFPPLPSVLEVIKDAATSVHRYPHLTAAPVAEALGARFDVDGTGPVGASGIVVSTGSVAVLQQVLSAVAGDGDEVVYAWRSFEAYPIAVGVTGATAIPVPLTADARHDLPAMAQAVTERTRAVVVCSPNNPTGPAVHETELRQLLDAVPNDVLVVLDEAYVEFVRDPAVADGPALMREYPNLVVLRTFSKAYGLANLRVGFAVARPEVADVVRSVSTPFGVSGIAQAAALASLEPDAELDLMSRVNSVVYERDRVTAALANAGWSIPEAQGNFVWLPLTDQALEFAQSAQEAGILVRPFAGSGVRVSIGEPEANDVFIALARNWEQRHL